MPVGVMLDSMDAVEWQRWLEFNEVNPIGDERDDLRAAMVCSTVAQVHGARTKPSDFIPEFGPRPQREPMTDDQLRDQAMKLTAMLGGKIRRKQ